MPDPSLKIPDRLNLAVMVAASVGAVFLVQTASATQSWLIFLFCVLGFSYCGNTIFSLMHEAVHGYLFTNRKWNEISGVFLAMFFPTSFSFQRVMHLGHHQRNRTDAEMFDLYYPDDNRTLKQLQFYGIFTGPYWLLAPLTSLLVALFPVLISPEFAGGYQWKWLRRSGALEMLTGLRRVSIRRIQLEVLLTVLGQLAIIQLLNISLTTWIACYLAFAVNWGALQYADHAFSIRDVRNGAWNLKVSVPVRYIFLNYHLHLAHHQFPQVPWLYLPDYVSDNDPQPTFWKVFSEMLRGPRVTTETCKQGLDPDLAAELKRQAG